jgi:dienelactone hydrolase
MQRKMFSLAAAGLAACCLTQVVVAQMRPTPEARAREAVEWLLAGEYRKLYDASTQQMKHAASVEAWKARAGPVTASLGKLIAFGEAKTEATAAGTGVVLPAKFEKGDFEFNVLVDASGQIGSLFVRPVTSKTAYAHPAYSKPDSYTERELTVGSDEWKLPATLTLPKGGTKLAAVVLVHGSGAHDRDETVFANKPFRDQAEGLASRGVAVLHYEKRNKVHQARLLPLQHFTPQEETVEDAVRAAALLATIPEIDPKRIYVLGHSLGGYLLPEILQQAPKVAGGIVLAGTTRPLEDVMVEQYEYLVPLQTAGSEELKKQGEKALADVRAGAAEVKALTPADESGAPILNIPRSYWLALKGYNPPALAASFPTRWLILQGERDYQVTMTDFANWKAALANRKDVVFKSYPALNHLFEQGVGKSTPEEYAKADHVSAEVTEDIARWMLER